LNQKPIRWVLGTGFGTAVDADPVLHQDAHMLPLQIIIETGVIGLIVATYLFSTILRYLYVSEVGFKPLFWATVALLIGSLTQETFYPVPALGHFIGFYLCSVAIALRMKIFRRQNERRMVKNYLDRGNLK
jgi:hypothetical protein